MNSITLTGKIYNQNSENEKFFKFSIGVYNSYKKEMEFFSCIAFGKTGEKLEQFFPTAGMPISITGELNINEYQEKKYYTIKIRDFSFVPLEKAQEPEASTGADVPF